MKIKMNDTINNEVNIQNENYVHLMQNESNKLKPHMEAYEELSNEELVIRFTGKE